MMNNDRESINRWESQEVYDRHKHDLGRINEYYPEGIDLECVAICDAMNKYPGIKTVSSCSGHGKRDFNIFFESTNSKSLAWIIFHTSYLTPNWLISVDTEGTAKEVSYRLCGSHKDRTEGFCWANQMAKSLETTLLRFLENKEKSLNKKQEAVIDEICEKFCHIVNPEALTDTSDAMRVWIKEDWKKQALPLFDKLLKIETEVGDE